MKAVRKTTKQIEQGKSNAQKTRSTRKSSTPKPTEKKIVRKNKPTGVPQIENILESVSDGFVAFDADLNYTYVNKRGGEMLGRKPAALIGKNYWTEYPEAEGSTFANAYLRALKEQIPLEIEDYYEPFNRWFENRIYPSPNGLSIFFHDITDHKKAELALKEQERLTSAIVNTTPALIYIYDMETQRIVYSNAGMEQLLGFSFRQIQAMGARVFVRLIHPDDLQNVLDFQPKLMTATDEDIFEIEYRMKGREGGWHTLHSYERPFLRNADGSLKQKLGVAIDVTERKRAQEELQRDEQVLRLFVENSPASIAMFDRDMKYIVASRRYLIDYDLGDLDVTGRSHYDLFPDIPERWKEVHRRCLAGATEKNEEDPFPRASGKTDWVHWEIRPWYERTEEVGGIILFSEVITKRKQAEEKLIQSQELFSTAFHVSPAGIIITRIADGKIMDANKAFLDLFEFSREEALGHTSTELSMWTIEEREKLIHAQIASGGLQNFELQAHSKSGKLVNLLFSSKPIEIGGEACHITTLIDISERKRAEDALRESKLQLEMTIRASNTGLWDWDLKTNRVYFSREWKQQIGYEDSEISNDFSEWQSRVHPDDLERATATVQRFLEAPYPNYENEFRFRHKDGNYRWILAKASLINDEQGKPNRMLGSHLDITERKKAEEKLRESETRFRAFVTTSSNVVYRMSPDWSVMRQLDGRGFIVDTIQPNDAWLQEYIHPEDQPLVTTVINTAIRTKNIFELEHRVRRVDGTLGWTLSRAIPLLDEHGAITEWFGAATDVTERKQAEQKLELQNRRLKILREIDTAILSAESTESIINAALKHTRKLLDCQRANLTLIDWETNESVIFNVSTENETAIPTGRRFPLAQYQDIITVLSQNQILLMNDLHALSDPRPAVQSLIKDGLQSLCSLPLFSHGKLLGMLTMHSETPGFFDEERIILSREVANQVAIAITQNNLLEETRLSRDRLAELSRKLVETQEKESRAIGRELHDQIGQMLTALKLTMEIAPQLPPDLAAKKSAQSYELVKDLLSRVSALSLELRPPMLDDLGLIPALTWHVNRFQEQTDIEVEFKHSGVEGRRFFLEIETTAYRAIQEALTNVARHAEATRARLEVHAKGDVLSLEIEDNGKGFNPQAEMAKHRSSGLRGIRERVSLVGGTFQIESQPGMGTKKIIQLPIS